MFMVKAGAVVLGLVLIALAIVAILLTGAMMGPLKHEIETNLATALPGPVHIERVSFSPRERALCFHGLSTASERTEVPLLECDRVVVIPDFSTLLSEVITIRAVILDRPILRLANAIDVREPLAYVQKSLKDKEFNIAGRTVRVDRIELAKAGPAGQQALDRKQPQTDKAPVGAMPAAPEHSAEPGLDALLGDF